MGDTTVKVKFIGDAKDLEKALKDVDRSAEKTGRGFGDFAKSAALGLGAVGVGAAVVGKQLVDAASDMNESLSKVTVVFGEQAEEIKKWSKTAAKSLGISSQKALEAAGTFGNLFSAMKISKEESAKMSKGIVGLASDLASFNNANPEDVLIALKAGLVGETEPLRAFGVNLSAARIEAEAFSMGLVKGEVDLLKLKVAQQKVVETNAAHVKAMKEHGATSAEATKTSLALQQAEAALSKVMEGKVPPLDAAQKATAAYKLIMDDTSLAQGDFARTADGAANQQRILAAQVEDVKAKLGQKILPLYVAALKFAVEDLVPWVEQTAKDIETWWAKQDGLKEALRTAGEQVKAFVEDIKILIGWIKDAVEWTQKLIDKWNSLPGADVSLLDLEKKVPGPRIPWDKRLIDVIRGFDSGGVVGGPRGAPQLAMVHGGETILPTHKGGAYGGGVTVIVQGSVLSERDLIGVINNALRRGVLVGG